jgi:holo-[acyl-carrier protein] synthase
VRIGIDLLRIDELTALLERPWFLEYAYADEERQAAEEMSGSRAREFLTGRFAGKEAVAKALGCGFARGVTPRQIGVLRGPGGAPQVRLTGVAAERAREDDVATVLVSITHKDSLVAAVALALGTKTPT